MVGTPPPFDTEGLPPRRVLIVEDVPLVRGLLATSLERFGFDVSTAANAAEAAALCRKNDPDGLVVDVELGEGPNGIDLVSGLLPDYPHLGVVFLSRVPEARFVGAQTPARRPNIAWLRKQDIADPSRLVEALDAVLRDVSEGTWRADLSPDRPLARLSRSQVDLLRLIGEGLSNEEIARRRGTSLRAVEKLIRRTLIGAGVRPDGEHNLRVQAVRLIATEAELPR